MTNIVPIGQARRSTAMQQRLKAGQGLNRNFADNVGDSFPKLSIKGRVFRIRIDGKETPLIDQQTRQPIPFLDVVAVNASPHLAKNFYLRGYEEGDFNPPDCWSLDGLRPDPSVANKQAPTCVGCPNNVFGSRMTPSGKAAKACADSRRIAVVFPGHLGTEDTPMVFMLKVPQASLKNLKAYSQLLDRNGYDMPGCVTRLSFDYNVAHPKLEFTFVDGLTDEEEAQATEIAGSDLVTGMLNAPDFDVEVSVDQPAQPTTGRTARQAPPVMGEAETTAQATHAPPPGRQQPIAEGTVAAAQAQAAMAKATQAQPVEVKSNIIELPDGKLLDTVTNQYVERPAPKVSMPQLDPDILALPDGRFFNKATNKFVVSGIVGAGEVTVEEPPKRRASRKAAKGTEVGAGGDATSATTTAPPVEMKAAEASEEQANHSVDATANGGDDGETGEVLRAPRGLHDLIAAAIPQRKQ